MTQLSTNRLLGYADDARLLILNADDFGMCHSNTAAIWQALTRGIATSTTLMTACPWAPHAMQLLQQHPEIAFGVHLTLVGDFANYRWGPVAPVTSVPTLLDATGRFFGSDDAIPALLERARLDEVETEFRAQIETVLAAGLRPTHLDWHCLADGGREDIFELSRKLAREYGLAMRVHDRHHAISCQQADLPVVDYDVLDSYRLDPVRKASIYAGLLRSLPPGLTEWAVHPGLGNDESQVLEPSTWQVRRTDYDFMISLEASEIVAAEGIVLLSYRELQAVWGSGV